jgi:2-haloacid dehalogenase
MEPLRSVLADGGAPPGALETWFAAALRDGFALAAAGASAPFREVARAAAESVLAGIDEARRSASETAARLVEAMQRLRVHPDVPDGLRALAVAGVRVVTLTNGAADTARRLLDEAGVGSLVEAHLSVEDAGRWKPHPDAYAYAARACGVAPERVLLVAAHPWDVDGAQRAGMSAAWLDRAGVPFPHVLRRPPVTATDLVGVAAAIAGRGSAGDGERGRGDQGHGQPGVDGARAAGVREQRRE